MRACLDTNILVSGIFWKGVPGRILDHWVKNDFDIVATMPVLTEYQRVLRELGSKIDVNLTDEWVRVLVERATIVIPMIGIKRWSRDVNDDKFVQCALAGKVDYLVTGDKDLLEMDDRLPFEMVRPREFLDCL